MSVGVEGIFVHARQICVPALEVTDAIVFAYNPSRTFCRRKWNSSAIRIQGALDTACQSAGVRFEDKFYCEVSERLLLLP